MFLLCSDLSIGARLHFAQRRRDSGLLIDSPKPELDEATDSQARGHTNVALTATGRSQ
jgi:hypothetical protein